MNCTCTQRQILVNTAAMIQVYYPTIDYRMLECKYVVVPKFELTLAMMRSSLVCTFSSNKTDLNKKLLRTKYSQKLVLSNFTHLKES